jgi:hypothetical protein
VTVCDAAFGQVVGRQFHGYAITGEDANSVAAEFAGQMGQNGAVGIKLDTEQTARELFNDGPGYFDTIFFTQSSSSLLWCWRSVHTSNAYIIRQLEDSVPRLLRAGVRRPIRR